MSYWINIYEPVTDIYGKSTPIVHVFHTYEEARSVAKDNCLETIELIIKDGE